MKIHIYFCIKTRAHFILDYKIYLLSLRLAQYLRLVKLSLFRVKEYIRCEILGDCFVITGLIKVTILVKYYQSLNDDNIYIRIENP